MNPELPPQPRAELEARVTAYLLGELPAHEAAAFRQQMDDDAPLAELCDKLRPAIKLLREAAATPETPTAETAPLKLSDERRQKLLAHFKTIQPKEFAPATRKQYLLFGKYSRLIELAACLVLLAFLAAIMLPKFGGPKGRLIAQSSSVINNLRQLDGAKQTWAQEKKKSPDDVPTMDDLKPYLGRGPSGSIPPSIAGEKYVLGKVGESPMAVVSVTNFINLSGELTGEKPPKGAREEMVRLDAEGRLAYVNKNENATFAAESAKIPAQAEIVATDELIRRRANTITARKLAADAAASTPAAISAPQTTIVLPPANQLADSHSPVIQSEKLGVGFSSAQPVATGGSFGFGAGGGGGGAGYNFGRLGKDSGGQNQIPLGFAQSGNNQNGQSVFDSQAQTTTAPFGGNPTWSGALNGPAQNSIANNGVIANNNTFVFDVNHQPIQDALNVNANGKFAVKQGNVAISNFDPTTGLPISPAPQSLLGLTANTSPQPIAAPAMTPPAANDGLDIWNLGEGTARPPAPPAPAVVPTEKVPLLGDVPATGNLFKSPGASPQPESGTYVGGINGQASSTYAGTDQKYNLGEPTVVDGIPVPNRVYLGNGIAEPLSLPPAASPALSAVRQPRPNQPLKASEGRVPGTDEPGMLRDRAQLATPLRGAVATTTQPAAATAAVVPMVTGANFSPSALVTSTNFIEPQSNNQLPQIQLAQNQQSNIELPKQPMVAGGQKSSEDKANRAPGYKYPLDGGAVADQFELDKPKELHVVGYVNVPITNVFNSVTTTPPPSGLALALPPAAPVISDSLKETPPAGAAFGIDPETHSLLIMTDPATFKQISNIVAALDSTSGQSASITIVPPPGANDSAAKGAAAAKVQPYSLSLANADPETVQNAMIKLFASSANGGRGPASSAATTPATPLEDRSKALLQQQNSTSAASAFGGQASPSVAAASPFGGAIPAQEAIATKKAKDEIEAKVQTKEILAPRAKPSGREYAKNGDAVASGPTGSLGPINVVHYNSLKIDKEAELGGEEKVLSKLEGLSNQELRKVLPEVAPDAVLKSLSEDLQATESKLAALRKDHGDNAPEVQRTLKIRDQLNQEIDDKVAGIKTGMELKVASLRAAIEMADEKLAEAKRDNDAALAKPAAPAPEPQPEVLTAENAFSTFSLNVSDVSFKLAGASLEKGVLPEPASIRSEEFLNAFDYRDPAPAPGAPIGFAWERAQDPFAQNRDLVRFSVKTAAAGREPGRPLNIVLLLDNSGSMERADRVKIIHEALRVLAGELQPQDKLSVVIFARTASLWVDGVSGSEAGKVAGAVDRLTPQGGTNLEEAMKLAYETARRHYLANGVNRVVLLTDGAANLGNVDPSALKQRVEENRKQGIALDCFGIGWEGYNDDLLEVLTRRGDGRYGFLNTPQEAATDFAGQLAGALRVAAADVKVQVEFNPARVTAYRQIGYAKHQLTKEQFRDNTVAAAQIGAAESGNGLYVVAVNPAGTGPLGIVRVRFKVPGTAEVQEHAWELTYTGNAVPLDQANPAMRLAATSSAFAEWLSQIPYAAEVTPDQLLRYLNGVPQIYGADTRPQKLEWMIRQAGSLSGK